MVIAYFECINWPFHPIRCFNCTKCEEIFDNGEELQIICDQINLTSSTSIIFTFSKECLKFQSKINSKGGR